MQRRMKKAAAKTIALALALSVAVQGGMAMDAPSASAAKSKKPKLSTKKVTVTVKRSKKVKIKNVKAGQVKKLSVKSSKKNIASAKKNGKTAFTVTGKKAGSSVITAKVTLKGKKKAVTLKAKVTVKGVVPPEPTKTADITAAPTGTPSQAPSQTPSQAPIQTPGGNEQPTTSEDPAGAKPTTRPVDPNGGGGSRPVADPLIEKTWNFDDGVGDGGEGEWFGRGAEQENDDGTTTPLVKVVSTDEAKSGKALMVTGRTRSGWEGPALDMSGIGTPGATYELSFSAKLPDKYAGKSVKFRVSGYYQVTEGSDWIGRNFPADKDRIMKADEWTTFSGDDSSLKGSVSFTMPSSFYCFYLYFETKGATEEENKYDFIIDDVTLKRTSAPDEPDLTLASIRDTYAPYVGTLGVALTYADLMNNTTLDFVKHHFNSVTMGNSMKPDALLGNEGATLKQSELGDSEITEGVEYVIPEGYADYAENKDAEGNVIVPKLNLKEVDKVLKICHDNGIKLRIHSPIWHQQMPEAFFCEKYDRSTDYVNKDVMLAREELYIRTMFRYFLTSPYADAVAAYDVVNEYTHMSNESPASENWWKYSFGKEMKTDCEYVKKAFVWANAERVLCERMDVSLIYNDYNTYEPKITDQIIELINNINKTDDVNTYGKICSGVGMQCHFNDNTATPEALRTALDKFAEQGYEIQITELDVTNTGEVKNTTSAADKEKVFAANAEMYSKIMTTLLDAKADGANISSITIWGLTDATSWRPNNAPVLFGADIADKKPSFGAVINAAVNYGK